MVGSRAEGEMALTIKRFYDASDFYDSVSRMTAENYALMIENGRRADYQRKVFARGQWNRVPTYLGEPIKQTKFPLYHQRANDPVEPYDDGWEAREKARMWASRRTGFLYSLPLAICLLGACVLPALWLAWVGIGIAIYSAVLGMSIYVEVSYGKNHVSQG